MVTVYKIGIFVREYFESKNRILQNDFVPIISDEIKFAFPLRSITQNKPYKILVNPGATYREKAKYKIDLRKYIVLKAFED